MLNGLRRSPSAAPGSRVVIASDSEAAAGELHQLIRDAGSFAVETRIINGRRSDPLDAVGDFPDLLLLRISEESLGALEALASRPVSERPPLIVIGDANRPRCMRAAMQAGARDFLMEPVPQQELIAAIMRIRSEQKPSAAPGRSKLTVFVGAKGGSGTTFLACNIAHLFAEVSQAKTVLLGLDMQFGSLPRYLDLQPKRYLLDALDVADDLDGAAIEAYLTRHESGLALLAPTKDGSLLQQELMTDRLSKTLDLLLANFQHCVVDIPRRIEAFNALALERAHQIVLVLQQSVPSLLDATRMHQLVTRDLGVSSDRIIVAVNRYSRTAAVELSHIQQLFEGVPLVCIPNDYRCVTESIDFGVPIHSHAKRSPVTKALINLQRQLAGKADADRSFLPRFLRSS
jgi:pilus assembly protein CpaE